MFGTFSVTMASSATEPGVGRVASLRRRYEPQVAALRGSETAKAAGLAVAMITNNLIALVSTIVFARLLSDYASLAALVSYFLILSVVGYAIQVSVARESVLGHLGVGAGLIATLRRWTWHLAIFTMAATVVSVLLRDPIAQAVGVKTDEWAAALGIPAGCLWIGLCYMRGALQGVGEYRSVGISLVGEQAVRLVVGAVLAAIGLGVTGAYLGTPISFVVMGIYCALELRRYVERTTLADAQTTATSTARAPTSAESPTERAPATGGPRMVPEAVPGLWSHVRSAWAPIAGLIVIAVLQNIDIIAAKHRFGSIHDLASSYAATAVAAKVLIWVAIGAGFYLVPEVSRRRAAGEDTRPVLARALAIILVCAVPVLLIFAFGAEPLLRIAFGPNRLKATSSLFILGVAFTVLAITYLAIQYMLALKRTWFLLAVGAVALAEPILLLQASRKPAGFAAVVLAVQVAGAVLALLIALRTGGERAPTAVSPEPV